MSLKFDTGAEVNTRVHFMIETYEDRHSPSRRYRVGNVPSLDEISLVLESLSENYCLFLAMDARLVTDETLQGVARLLLSKGLAYFCAWGPDCERVHDQFDLERMPEEPEGRTVMTTWHSKESLPEALWFFANCVEPDEGFEATCKDWVAISVSNEAWTRQIRGNLS